MPVLFPNFLNDPEEYLQAETHWRNEWTRLLGAVGESETWRSPWINTSFADGSPWRDGNPIFSAVCPSRQLGIRIIQEEPAENPSELTFWTDTFAEGEPETVRELVISCVLSTETLPTCRDLIGHWLKGEEVQITSRNGLAAEGQHDLLRPPAEHE